MLVSLRDVCSIAEQNNMAIAAVNSASLEAIRAAVEVAEETGYPIIIQHAEGHEDLIPLKYVAPIVTSLAERSSAQICINLDHCEHLAYAQRALDEGFTGVMFDGSYLPYEQNVEYSYRAHQMCQEYGAGLECELGSMGSREGGESDEGDTAAEAGAIYTDPDQAGEFIRDTGVLGYKLGTSFITKMYSSGIMDLVTKCASILGLLMIGAMTASFVKFQTILAVPVQGSDPIAIQTYLDAIFKGIVPLGLTMGCLGLMKKNVNVVWIIIGLMVLGMCLGIFGIC